MSFEILRLVKKFNREQREREAELRFEKLMREGKTTREGVDIDQWRTLQR